MNHSTVRKSATGSSLVLDMCGTRLGATRWLMVLGLFLVLISGNGVASAASLLDEQVLAAANRGDLAQVRRLLDKGADPNAKDAIGNMVLGEAAFSGNLDLVKFLIDQGSDVKAKRPDGQTVLMCAAIGGNPQVVRLLVEMGLDVNAKTSGGETALMWASMGGRLEAVKYLLENKAELNAKNASGDTALWYADMFLMGKDVAGYLRSIGAK
ncbi:MAG: ankyrin repeat domain-containing protein [Thermodesulfobacteriota bacterium]